MRFALFLVAALTAGVGVGAQTPAGQTAGQPAPAAAKPVPGQDVVCGQTIPTPAGQPPAGSGPIVLNIVLCFQKQGGYSVIEAATYQYYIQMTSRLSAPSQNKWVAYDESIEQVLREDFKRLMATNFLDDLSIESVDFVFPNGVVGKNIIYDMEERQRIKIVDYEGLKKVDQSKIEEKLKEKSIAIRLDSFIDAGLIRRVTGVVRELYAAEGYQFAEVVPEIKDAEGGPKLVHLTFHVTEGPKVKIREIDFVGNQELGDGTLQRKMKENKGRGFFSFITGGGTYKEDKFAEDAQAIIDHYRDEGYVMAQVGQPEMKTVEDSSDGKIRWVQLRVPITEGKSTSSASSASKATRSSTPTRSGRSSSWRRAKPTARSGSRRVSRRRRSCTARAATSSSRRTRIYSRAISRRTAKRARPVLRRRARPRRTARMVRPSST